MISSGKTHLFKQSTTWSWQSLSTLFGGYSVRSHNIFRNQMQWAVHCKPSQSGSMGTSSEMPVRWAFILDTEMPLHSNLCSRWASAYLNLSMFSKRLEFMFNYKHFNCLQMSSVWIKNVLNCFAEQNQSAELGLMEPKRREVTPIRILSPLNRFSLQHQHRLHSTLTLSCNIYISQRLTYRPRTLKTYFHKHHF